MHSHAMATGLAVARLLENPDPGLVVEAAEFAELARVKLALDNAAITSSMMFAQPLIKMWRPHWKFAYTVGLSIGVKFTTEGFYISDIIDHVTDEFTLGCLKEGECLALRLFDWAEIHARFRNFRNALVHVALERPLPAARPPTRMPRVVGEPEEPDLHCLIVDDSPFVLQLHRALVLGLKPNARIHTCTCTADAVRYVKDSNDRGNQIHLILLDLDVSLPTCEVEGDVVPDLDGVFSRPNGFDVAAALDEEDAPGCPVPSDFRYKPFVAMVSYLARPVMTRSLADGQMRQDGSLMGCDVLLPKPLGVDSMRVLVETCNP